MEIAAAAAILCFLVLLFFNRRRRFPRTALVLASLVVGAATWTALSYSALPDLEEGVANRPIEVHPDGYVSSRTCEACHPSQYESWHVSFHRTMTQVVTPETVVTELDGVVLEDKGRVYTIERRGEKYWVEQGGEAPPSPAKPLVMSTGSHSMQAYWMASGEERQVELLPFHYLMESDEWVPRRTAFLVPPDTDFVFADWNSGCIHCHTTRGQPRAESGGVDSRVAEFGIACEACHGPGAAHVIANRNPVHRYRLHLTDEADPDVVNPRRLSKERGSEVCGRCHGYAKPGEADVDDVQWSGHSFEPGSDLKSSREIVLIEELPDSASEDLTSMFWRDGMVRGSGREFGGLLESACYQQGELSCLSCHSMHQPPDDPRTAAEWRDDQLGPGKRGVEACAGCHPALVADIESHTHHPPDSVGSTCYNCHMPYTTYGLLKAIRSHEITNPSVQESLETGRPNACNGCHLDETLSWSAEYLQAWYDIPQPSLSAVQRSVAGSVLWGLSGDAAQRALTAWSMGWDSAREASGEGWMAPVLAQLLQDPYPAVRYIARRSIRRLPGFEGFEFDFIGPESEWHAAHQRALALWAEGPEFSAPAATLTTGRGRVHRKLFARLVAARNERDVVVAE